LNSLWLQKLSKITEKTYLFFHTDGSIRTIRDCAIPVTEQTGAVSRIIGIAEDITDSRRGEQALRESEEEYRLPRMLYPTVCGTGIAGQAWSTAVLHATGCSVKTRSHHSMNPGKTEYMSSTVTDS
jgi:hypothetical protein